MPFIEVGQGLCFVDPNNDFVYDMGGSITAEEFLRRFRVYFENVPSTINIVISHQDLDHIKFLPIILRFYCNANFNLYMNGVFHTEIRKIFRKFNILGYLRFVTWIYIDHDINVFPGRLIDDYATARNVVISRDNQYKVPDTGYIITKQSQSAIPNSNNNSMLAYRLCRNGEIDTLLTGDMSYRFISLADEQIITRREGELNTLTCRNFLVPHHGANNRSSTGTGIPDGILNIQADELSITYGLCNGYQHPRIEINNFPNTILNYSSITCSGTCSNTERNCQNWPLTCEKHNGRHRRRCWFHG